MRRNFTITENKRIVLFYSMLIFLLQSIAPAFAGLMSQSDEGYTDTLCTMYGPVTVFVQLDDDTRQTRADCYECTTCILQGHLNASAVVHVFWLDGLYLADTGDQSGPLYRVSNPPVYSPFLSRAPPA